MVKHLLAKWCLVIAVMGPAVLGRRSERAKGTRMHTLI